MEEYDLEAVLSQIRQILLKQPLTEKKTSGDTQQELQEALFFLRDRLDEVSEFLRRLSRGELDRNPPGRDNLFAGELKELHSGLLHLTWQASRVAQGDYHQRVNFLGQFSDAFNSMVEQLEEREQNLVVKAQVLSQSMKLLESVVDKMEEWLVVVEKSSGQVLYRNESAERELVFLRGIRPECMVNCGIEERILQYDADKDESHYEFFCETKKKMLAVDSFYIEWKGEGAYAHLVTDITKMEQLEAYAYQDELTGLNNRWSAITEMEKLLEEKRPFILCYVDMDGLKYVNDHFGHTYGDEYIKFVAVSLKVAAKKGELACRIGGDEFLWLCPGASEEEMDRRAEEFAQKIEYMEECYPMSVSYGCVSISADSSLSLKQALGQADEKMYSMKRARKKERRDQP